VGRAFVALPILLALFVTACGGQSRHHVVAQYITRVNAIETKLAQPLLEISHASRDFTKQHTPSAEVAKRLRQSAARVDEFRAQLAAITPPPEAKRMHALLLELALREASLAREVASLATFLPALSQTLRPLAGAGVPLRSALKSKARPAAKAAALDSYADTITVVRSRLGALRPPPVSAVVVRTQSATLRNVAASARALARALREHRNKDVAVLLRRFNAAAIGNRTVPAQRAQIAAIRAYDDRIRALTRLAVRLRREEGKLRVAAH
jgi:hypothetical protein